DGHHYAGSVTYHRVPWRCRVPGVAPGSHDSRRETAMTRATVSHHPPTLPVTRLRLGRLLLLLLVSGGGGLWRGSSVLPFLGDDLALACQGTLAHDPGGRQYGLARLVETAHPVPAPRGANSYTGRRAAGSDGGAAGGLARATPRAATGY